MSDNKKKKSTNEVNKYVFEYQKRGIMKEGKKE